MPSLDQKKMTNSFIISPDEEFSFKFDEDEIDSVIKASLSLKKNIVFLKDKNAIIKLKNEEAFVNDNEIVFIPHRLKKQFISIQEYLS